MDKKLAVVTGGNRGIGFEVSRQLANFGHRVILTSRDPEQGKTAAEKLQSEGLDVLFHPLDVTDPASAEALAGFVRERFGRLDILVNNAGILQDGGADAARLLDADLDMLRTTFETNTLGPVLVAHALVPLMQGRGRVVNVSSGAGQLADMGSGYPAYRVSKTALNAVTRILANELADTKILVNALCPGWVKTDMGGPGAARTPEQGADTVVWLATLPDNGPTGGFFRDRKPIPW
ncbi:SDR family oxidoreductase [Gloeobacter violaceus]|nr:SDR family oxidoreductase [Gloeobacter violaceus]